jgi:molybdopterin converting factor subunit 1
MENTIRITLHAFGRAREITGVKTQELELPTGITVLEVRHFLEKKYPLLNADLAYAVAINMQYADETDTVPHQAEVAILPPVSGG